MTGFVDRREKLSRWRFIRDYHRPARPVVVTDALQDWPGYTKWTADYFRSKIGEEPVILEGETFNKGRTTSFAQFLDEIATYEDLPPDAPQFLEEVPYVRRRSWTKKQQETIHKLIENDWSRPYFLPRSLYIRPLEILSSNPNRTHYPLFGVYFSPRGAVTGLHVDPMRSTAMLCQISGSKCGALFPPGKSEPWQDEEILSAQARRTRKIDVLSGKSPSYGGLQPIRFELRPGQTLYIPMGWGHEVFTTSNSISLTYNFIQLWGINFAWLNHPDTRDKFWRWVSTRFAAHGISARPAN